MNRILVLGRISRTLVIGALCAWLPSTAEASSGSKVFPEECAPLRQANEWVSNAPSLQMTSQFQRFGEEPQLAIEELVYTSDTVYTRDHPFRPWRAQKRPLTKMDAGSLEPDNCRRLYEATLDGARTVVFQYDKTLEKEKQWYRCNIWIETPNYRPLKAICEGPFEWTRRWFYRSDISVPIVNTDF